jgi:hypothetical protein
MKTAIDRLRINPRYRATLAPLSVKEQQQLAANIASEGAVLSPILYHLSASGDEVVVDGHHRYDFWIDNKESVETPATREVTELSGEDEEVVVKWIRNHQKGRRNDPTLIEQYDTGKEVIEKRFQGVPSAQFAAENEMSPSQARHAAFLAASIDEAEEVSPGFRDQILGDEKMSAAGAIRKAGSVKSPPANPLVSFEAIQKSLNALSRSVQVAINAFPEVGDPLSVAETIDGLYKDVKGWEDRCLETQK